jgi:hypothetical protein
LWIGEGVCLVLCAASVAVFFYSTATGDFVVRHGPLLLVWIGLVLSPLLWLEFAIFWALGPTSGERSIRIGGVLVFPGLVVATAAGLLLNPASADQLIQPVAFIWIFTVGLRLAHAMAVIHAAKSD